MKLTEEQEGAIKRVAGDLAEAMALAKKHMSEIKEQNRLADVGETFQCYRRISRGLLVLKHTFPLLEIEHPHDILPPQYPGFDQTQAWMEGWMFYYDAKQECCQVERIDSPSLHFPCAPAEPQFVYDDNALKFIRFHADACPGGYHDQALGYMLSVEGTHVPRDETNEEE